MGRNRSNATAPAVKGNLVAGTGTDTSGLLTVGANGTVLTADSAEATGIKWAAAAGGGANWTLLNAGGTTLSGTVTTVSGISGADKIMVLVDNASTSGASSPIWIRVNTLTSSIYTYYGANYSFNGASYNASNFADIRQDNGNDGIPIGVLSTSASSRVTAGLTMSGANSSGIKAYTSVGAVNGFGNTDFQHYFLQGLFNTSSTISSISVVSTSSSFDAGRVYVYTSA
jgi:hypothetical protein